MAKYSIDDIRNIALCGHGGAGKTTLAETLLAMTGAVKAAGSVDDGSSMLDFDDEEKHHKYSIESKVTHFDHEGLHVNLIDTPGYPDYIGQTLGALRGVETAAVVINAGAGIEVNTRRVFNEAGNQGLARMIIINKMDAENVDYPKLIETIKEVWGQTCIPLNVPIGAGHDFKGVVSCLEGSGDAAGALLDPNGIRDTLIEAIVEVDEKATEKYFEGEPPTGDELNRLLRESIVAGSLVPIVCTCAKAKIGLTELLQAFRRCAVPPTAIKRAGKDDSGETVDVKPDAEGQLVAQVFKTRIDPFVQKLSFIRVFSGHLAKDDSVAVTGVRKPMKIGALLTVQGAETHAVDSAGPGDIVAVAKMDDLHTGVCLGHVQLPPLKFPMPMVGLAVTPKSRGDEGKLSGALHKIVEEDSTFKLDRDAATKELVMTGMSELHLQIIQERLKRRDKVEVTTKEPKIPYRETITANAEDSYRHKKQSGGRGQFGEVHIRMYPFPDETDPAEFCSSDRFPQMKEYHFDEDNNFLWVNSVVGGTIPSNFLPAVEKGFKERMTRGVIAGYQVVNVCVEVHFGKYHDVDSSEAAFKTAGSMAFRNTFQQAKPALLEPIVQIHVTVQGDKLGDINSDLSGRRGRVLGTDAAGGGMMVVTAEVPLSEVTTYARTLSSITGGQGSYTMEFSRYDVVPGNVQQEIISKAKLAEEEED